MGSEKIKILHLIASRAIGGAERVLLTLSKNIDRENFNLVLGIFIDQRKSIDFLWEKAGKLDSLLEPIKFKNPYNLLQILHIYRIVKKHHPDIIHTHGYKTNVLGFLVAKLFGIPIVTTVHGFYSNKMKTEILLRLSLMLLRHFDRIIVVSDQIKAELERAQVSSKKMRLIKNVPFIETKENLASASTFREEFGIPFNAKLIGFVGRLEPVKDCSLFIKTIPRVIKSNPDSHFVVVGDGSERKSLESRYGTMHRKSGILLWFP